ncbi:MAG: Type 1 glutamine amidotransferase-like domain-containing protein [Anaerolineales bacterium]
MLALVGSGEYLPPMEPVDRILLGRLPDPPRVVCLPTAAGTEGSERIGYWSHLGEDHFTRLGVPVQSLPVVDRASANDHALARAIAEANFVYLSGGKPAYLYQTLESSLAWESILAVIRSGGLLSGCSAGAMIMGEAFFSFSGRSRQAGFRLLPGATVIPHYDEIPDWVVAPVRGWITQGLTLIGIEANTALFHNDHQMEVLGAGGVTVWNTAGKIRYTQGPLPDWNDR